MENTFAMGLGASWPASQLPLDLAGLAGEQVGGPEWPILEDTRSAHQVLAALSTLSLYCRPQWSVQLQATLFLAGIRVIACHNLDRRLLICFD